MNIQYHEYKIQWQIQYTNTNQTKLFLINFILCGNSSSGPLTACNFDFSWKEGSSIRETGGKRKKKIEKIILFFLLLLSFISKFKCGLTWSRGAYFWTIFIYMTFWYKLATFSLVIHPTYQLVSSSVCGLKSCRLVIVMCTESYQQGWTGQIQRANWGRRGGVGQQMGNDFPSLTFLFLETMLETS